MQLKDNLYKIEQTADDKRSFSLRLLPDSVIYKAHFPERPITPGVCVIKIADELLQNVLGRKLTPVKISNAKFLYVIDPLETEIITYNIRKLNLDEESGLVKAQIDVLNPEHLFSKLSLQYQLS